MRERPALVFDSRQTILGQIMSATDAPRHIVRRFNWKCTYDGDQLHRAPGEHRVAWFDTEADAHAESARREADVRGRVNPFRCGPAFHYLSTFPLYAFRDWLLDAAIAPPDGDDLKAWATWWDDTPDPAARARAWDGLNRVRFHDVIARRPSEVAYAVVQILWDYDDSFYGPGEEGGRVVKAYRTRERAEAERLALTERAKANWGRDDPGLYADRWLCENWPVVRDETVEGFEHCPLYEVVEIDLGRAEVGR